MRKFKLIYLNNWKKILLPIDKMLHTPIQVV